MHWLYMCYMELQCSARSWIKSAIDVLYKLRSILHCPCIKKSLIVRIKKSTYESVTQRKRCILFQMGRNLSNRLEAGLNTRVTKTLREESLVHWWICAVRSTTVTWKHTFNPLNIFTPFLCPVQSWQVYMFLYTNTYNSSLGFSIKHIHSSFAWWQVAEYQYIIQGGRYLNWTLKHLHSRRQHSFKLNFYQSFAN